MSQGLCGSWRRSDPSRDSYPPPPALLTYICLSDILSEWGRWFVEPDTSRHYRKWEPQTSPSDSLFQTFLDFLSFPTDLIKTHLSGFPFPKGRSIFLVSFCASSDVGLRTSLLVRKHDLHFLCNRKPLCVCRVLLEEARRTSTSWGLEGKEGGDQGQSSLSPLGISQAAALSPPSGMGLVGSCGLCSKMFSAACSGWRCAVLEWERQPSLGAVP